MTNLLLVPLATLLVVSCTKAAKRTDAAATKSDSGAIG